MDPKPRLQSDPVTVDSPESVDRRELARKLGRFAAYAAPFTVLAMTADGGGTSHGSGKKSGG